MKKSKKGFFVLVQFLLAIPLLFWPVAMFTNVIIMASAAGPAGPGYVPLPLSLLAFLCAVYPIVFLVPIAVSLIKREYLTQWQFFPVLCLLLISFFVSFLW